MSGPYAGLKVIEFGRFIAAPYCGQLFSDGGADVIKIEPLHGDDARRNGTRLGPTEARQFLNKNRGKRSIALNLSDVRVFAAVQNLVQTADVVISNFRPGSAEKLGLDYATVASNNPGIVYAENTAFGKKGPLAGKVGMDLLLQGHTGLAEMTKKGPVEIGDPIIDYSAAMLMAWGIATALYHREKIGVGQRLDVSLLQAALVIQNNAINHVDMVDSWRHEFVDYLKDAFNGGQSLQDILDHRDRVKPPIKSPYYGFYTTSDGYLAIAAGSRGLRVRTAALLGIDDPSIDDPDYLPPDILDYTARMRGHCAEIIANKTTSHWLTVFSEAKLPAAAVQFRDQVLDDEQSWENEYLVRLEHEDLGGMTVVAPPVKFSETALATYGASPPLGKHTTEILSEAGLSGEEIDALLADNVVHQHTPKPAGK